MTTWAELYAWLYSAMKRLLRIEKKRAPKKPEMRARADGWADDS